MTPVSGRLAGHGGSPPRPTSDPWDGFERSLAVQLGRPGSSGAIEFSGPPERSGRRGRCVVHLGGGGSPAWVTVGTSDHPLAQELLVHSSPPDAGPLARAVVGACRDRLGVPHPQLLTLRSEGPVGRGVGRLGLVRTDCVPIGLDPADSPHPVDVAVEVTGHEDVRERIEVIVERITGRPTIVDDDGDLVFDHDGHPVHVTCAEDDASARIWAWVARGVRSRTDAAVELVRLNREEEWTTWVLDGRHVMQRTTLVVGPFLPRHVQFSLEHFLLTFATTRADLAARLGRR